MANSFYHRMALIVAGGLMLSQVGCTRVDKRIDRATGGPQRLVDTTVQVDAAAQPSPAPDARDVPAGALTISISQAILLCLTNNRSLVVKRLNPTIRQTFEDQQRAVFDPIIAAEVSAGRDQGERLARSGSQTEEYTSDTTAGVISMAQYFPTGTTPGRRRRYTNDRLLA